MFYYNGNRWTKYPYKITYTKTETVYDIDPSGYEGEEDFKFEEVTLTDDQLARLESVAHVTTMSLGSLIQYVMNEDVPQKPSAEFVEAMVAKEERDAMRELIDPGTVSGKSLRKMKKLIRPYQIGAFYEKRDLVDVDGALYVVTKPHTASEELPPSTTRSHYKLRRE